MKTTILSFLFAAGISAAALAGTISGSTMLMFETADGKMLEMEMTQEPAFVDDIPAGIRQEVSNQVIDPENHKFFQALIKAIQKCEKEEDLPFELD